MESAIFWVVDRHEQLTAPVRAWLQATYAYVAPAQHTYAALITIRAEGPAGVHCIETFPYSFVVAGMLAGTLEGLIDAECRSRMLARRNAADLITIVGTRHPL